MDAAVDEVTALFLLDAEIHGLPTPMWDSDGFSTHELVAGISFLHNTKHQLANICHDIVYPRVSGTAKTALLALVHATAKKSDDVDWCVLAGERAAAVWRKCG